MIYSVVCTDVNDYVDWQCELLAYSWRRAAQPGELLRLVCAPPDVAPPACEGVRIVRTPPGESTGGYLAFQRLFSLRDWLEAEKPVGTVLLLDPDCVFRAAVAAEVAPGAPIAQHWLDHRAAPPSQDATWPALIHTEDLAHLLPRWIDFTRAIHGATRRWESDMTAFVSAAATAGLRFSLEPLAAFVGWPDEAVGRAPIVHYCQDVVDAAGEVLWAKRSYRPWSRVEGGSRARHAYCADLLAILDELAALKRSA